MPPMIEALEGRQLKSMTAESEMMTESDPTQTVIVMENDADAAKAQAEMDKVKQLYDAITNILKAYNDLNMSVIRTIR